MEKHGTCSGLSAARYFGAARAAYGHINRPEVFRKLDRAVEVPAQVIEEAFIKANPTLEPDMITVICKSARVQEVRAYLSKDHLTPVTCGADVQRDCTLDDALLDPVR